MPPRCTGPAQSRTTCSSGAMGGAMSSASNALSPAGSGTPVVLVHGSLATGADEWQAQRPLAEEGFRLIVADRRGYGRSPAAAGED